ncbi:molybdopterin biosynthesis protein [Clostridium gelidum]|uniref:Molybdopterin molybdenumtransferase n=1 Tax=Clostridium gelidum TaxID=704125 RepID=A0ABN6IYK7_9CLOT|nr:molybdopterin-binding protein [Clostridium gelidum]BCZ46503.1 molybdopterin biosynthesis protein [Clostridium gelidum]
MKKIKTTEAVGYVICHDITQIIKGEKKGIAFKKGHIVSSEDIPVLLSIGKDNLYVWEKEEGMLHENEAAEILCKVCKNDYMSTSDVKEGKIELFATEGGLLKIDIEKLREINSFGEMMIATRHSNFPVRKGDKLAGTRIIPLVIEQRKMEEAVKLVGDKPMMEILPFTNKKVGIVTTGNEVFYGRIKDTFGPVIREKLEDYNVEVLGQKILNDDPKLITQAIKDFIKEGAELIICTGGMSVDPDDTTPTAIQNTGAKIVSYGAPVLPGAMFLLAYYNDTLPIIGLPGCVMYAKRTIFDLVLPRIMANDKITLEDLASFGHGGLCLSCDICSFPNCSFGK